MNKGYFHSSGTLPIVMYPDRFHVQDFVFTVDGEEWDITYFTWQLVIKSNKGNNVNLLSLTLNNGLSFPAYEVNRLRARFEAAQLSAIGEGSYFWMLIKTDTNEPILKGECILSFDPEASGTEAEVTVGIINNTVEVQIQSLLTGNSSGGSGSSVTPVTDFSMTSSLPSNPTDGQRYRIRTSPSNVGVMIGNVTYYHGNTIEYVASGSYWIVYPSESSDQ